MELSIDRLSAYCLIQITGDIDTTTSPNLQDALLKELNEGASNFIVDMANVRYISSMGLRVFLSHLKKLQSINGRLLLSGANKLVTDVFEMSGFANYLALLPDTESAKQQLESPA